MLPSQVFVSSCKRKRGPNWSEKEKVVLVDEYRRHRNILRPKGSTTSSVVEREKAWDEICAALKIVSGPYVKRDVVDVRKKWDNLCFWAKKCIAEWKDKHHTEDGIQAALTGDHSPPTLALKILAIYQEEWVDLFPNAQVVDGGEVFFVFNNDNHNTKQVTQANSVYTADNGDGSKAKTGEDEDIFEVEDGEEEINEMKSECSPAVHEDTDGGWQPDAVPGEEQSYQDFSVDTLNKQQKRPPPNHVINSLPHHFIQRRYFNQASSPPLDDTSSLPQPASSLSPIVTSAPHTTSPIASHHHHYMPYHPHTSIPSSFVPNQQLHTKQTTNNIPRASSPSSKRMRYSQLAAEDDHHSDMDDEKDIEQLSKELLILRKGKLVLEKQKLEIEKEKLVIERDILDMQRERQWLELEKDRMANGQIN